MMTFCYFLISVETIAFGNSSLGIPFAKKAKDVAAGAVLISAAGSVVIALLILGPHILTYLSLAG